MAEQTAHNRWVLGSNPSGATLNGRSGNGRFCYIIYPSNYKSDLLLEINNFNYAISQLKLCKQNLQNDSENPINEINPAKEEVLSVYQPIFSPENLENLTEQDYKSFLLFKNNRHWTGLHRIGGKATEDMGLLRQALKILIDESKPIEQRLDILRPRTQQPMVPYLGKAVLTAILHVSFPEKYAVWNNTTESALKDLKIWPQFERGSSLGERYVEVNSIVTKLSKALDIDLWHLDSIFWFVADQQAEMEDNQKIDESDTIVAISPRFGLERHLHEFIYDNWDAIEYFSDWELYEEDGDVAAYEYHTGEVGRIDLLATHKRDQNRWLVIELKRHKSSDVVIGQILRYMGWAKENLAGSSGSVEGLIISKISDTKMKYALSQVSNIDLLLYEVEFNLRKQ